YRAVLESGSAQQFELAEIFYGRFLCINVELYPIKTAGKVSGISCLVRNNTTDYLRSRLSAALSNFKSKVIDIRTVKDLLWAVTDEVLSRLHLEDAIILMKEGGKLQLKTAYGNKRAGQRKIDS